MEDHDRRREGCKFTSCNPAFYSGSNHFVIQPFVAEYKKHMAIYEKARAAYTGATA